MKAHFILYVADQSTSTGFYSRVLGRKPDLDAPGMTEFHLSADAILGLMPVAGVQRLLGGGVVEPAGSGGAKSEVYLVVDDPAEYHARSLAAGARELSAPAIRDWGHEAAYSADPDGHVLAFARVSGSRTANPVRSLAWMGVRTARVRDMCAFYRDTLGLDVILDEPEEGRFRLADGTEVHVYAGDDPDHAFFGSGPVVGLEVESFRDAHRALRAAGVEFLYPEPQREQGRAWQHFRAPDGNVYEIIGKDDIA